MDTEMSAHERLVSGFLLHAITVISLSTLNIISTYHITVSNFTLIIFLGKTHDVSFKHTIALAETKNPIGHLDFD